MQVLTFCEFGLKTPIHVPKMGVLGDLTPKWGTISSEPPKFTNDCRNTSFESLGVKIGLKLLPVGVAKNG